jgi:hypothetical protein
LSPRLRCAGGRTRLLDASPLSPGAPGADSKGCPLMQRGDSVVAGSKSDDHRTFDAFDIDSYTESIRKDLRTVSMPAAPAARPALLVSGQGSTMSYGWLPAGLRPRPLGEAPEPLPLPEAHDLPAAVSVACWGQPRSAGLSCKTRTMLGLPVLSHKMPGLVSPRATQDGLILPRKSSKQLSSLPADGTPAVPPNREGSDSGQRVGKYPIKFLSFACGDHSQARLFSPCA